MYHDKIKSVYTILYKVILYKVTPKSLVSPYNCFLLLNFSSFLPLFPLLYGISFFLFDSYEDKGLGLWGFPVVRSSLRLKSAWQDRVKILREGGSSEIFDWTPGLKYLELVQSLNFCYICQKIPSNYSRLSWLFSHSHSKSSSHLRVSFKHDWHSSGGEIQRLIQRMCVNMALKGKGSIEKYSPHYIYNILQYRYKTLFLLEL